MDIDWNKVASALSERANVHRHNATMFEDKNPQSFVTDVPNHRDRQLREVVARERLLCEVMTDLATALATGTGYPIQYP